MSLKHGRFEPCPDAPHCVSSQETGPKFIEPAAYTGSAVDALNQVTRVIQEMKRAKITEQTENYIHAEFRTRIFGFVDDVEIYLDEAAGRIHFRSCSRTGYYDFGANRRRIERLRKAFRAQSD